RPFRGSVLEILQRDEIDEAQRTSDLAHHVIAGIDAEATADAFELRSVADVDSGRADMETGAAVDAVTPPFPGLAGLVLAARLTPPALIGDDQRMLVLHGGLQPRPGAHIGADLLARPAGQPIGGQGEQAKEEIGGA